MAKQDDGRAQDAAMPADSPAVTKLEMGASKNGSDALIVQLDHPAKLDGNDIKPGAYTLIRPGQVIELPADQVDAFKGRSGVDAFRWKEVGA